MQSRSPYIFSVDKRYEQGESEERHAWTSLTDIVQNGVVHIENPQQYGLEPSLLPPEVPGSDTYHVSMFHQLHCLASTSLRSSSRS